MNEVPQRIMRMMWAEALILATVAADGFMAVGHFVKKG
jgi:hypothetical protein